MSRQTDPAHRRLALLIATSEYSDPALRQLRAPGHDASDLAEVLGTPRIGGFTVRMLINARCGKLLEEIAEFCHDRRPDDQLLIYLSCHGVLDDRGRLWYAATDTRRQLTAATAVGSGWLNERLEDCRARSQILVLDCCHSGAFASGAKGQADLALEQRFRPTGRGRIVLTASRGTEYSFEGDRPSGGGVRSVFTQAIVEGLRTGDADRDKDGLITVTDLYHYVYDRVRSAEPRQTPELFLYGAEGDVLLAHGVRGAEKMPAVPGANAPRQRGDYYPGRAAADRPRAPLAPLGTLLFRMETSHSVDGVAFSPDGARLATVGDGSGSPLMWDVATGTKLGQIRHEDLIADPARKALAFSPDGTWLATGGHNALVRDAATGRELTRMERHGYFVTAVAFSPDGTLLATADDDGMARLWDAATGRELVRMPHGDDVEVAAVAFSPDGTLLATADDYGLARLWETATGREQARMEHGGEILMAVAFSPDGVQLATGGTSGARLWDVATRVEVAWMELDHSWISAVAFSPDGTRLATGGDDGTARLWQAATRRELARMEHGTLPPETQSKPRRRRGKRQAPDERKVDVKAVAFSPDGTLLATGGDDKTARLWAI